MIVEDTIATSLTVFSETVSFWYSQFFFQKFQLNKLQTTNVNPLISLLNMQNLESFYYSTAFKIDNISFVLRTYALRTPYGFYTDLSSNSTNFEVKTNWITQYLNAFYFNLIKLHALAYRWSVQTEATA